MGVKTYGDPRSSASRRRGSGTHPHGMGRRAQERRANEGQQMPTRVVQVRSRGVGPVKRLPRMQSLLLDIRDPGPAVQRAATTVWDRLRRRQGDSYDNEVWLSIGRHVSTAGSGPKASGLDPSSCAYRRMCHILPAPRYQLDHTKTCRLNHLNSQKPNGMRDFPSLLSTARCVGAGCCGNACWNSHQDAGLGCLARFCGRDTSAEVSTQLQPIGANRSASWFSDRLLDV